MKKRVFSIFFIFLVLLSSLVMAKSEEPPKMFDYDLAYGKDIEINFRGFGEYALQVREGSTVKFNFGTIKNTLIIEKIEDHTIKGKLSLVDGAFEDYELELGVKEHELKLTDHVPFMLIRFLRMTPSEDPSKQTAILEFRMPFVTDLSNLQNIPAVIKITNSTNITEPEEDTNLKWLVVVIIILLLLIIFLGPKQFKKRKSKKSDEKKKPEDKKEDKIN